MIPQLEQRKQLILSYLEKGKIGSITFVKADGSLREASVRLWKEAALSSGDRNQVQENSTAHKPEILTMYDVIGDKWIKVNVGNIKKWAAGGKVYEY